MDQAQITANIHLQAINPDRNVARDYRIALSMDLFGHWIIDLHWGRIGTRGQKRTVSFADAEHAVRFVRHTLTRRAGSQKRIGVAYGPVAFAFRPANLVP